MAHENSRVHDLLVHENPHVHDLLVHENPHVPDLLVHENFLEGVLMGYGNSHVRDLMLVYENYHEAFVLY
jgi:hypothetical protein